MFGYAGRRRRVGRRTGARGRRIIAPGHDRSRVGQTMVEDSGRRRGGLAMARGLGRSRVGRITVGESGRRRGDLTMAQALGHNLVGRIMVEEFGRSRAGRTTVEDPDRNPVGPTMVQVQDLVVPMGARALNRVGPIVGRDLNLIVRMAGNGHSLRAPTIMARDLSRLSPAVAVGRAGRRLGSRARLLLIGGPSLPTGATNARNRSDRFEPSRHR